MHEGVESGPFSDAAARRVAMSVRPDRQWRVLVTHKDIHSMVCEVFERPLSIDHVGQAKPWSLFVARTPAAGTRDALHIHITWYRSAPSRR